MDVAAAALDALDQPLEPVVEALQRRLLDRPGLVAQGVALGQLGEGLAPQRDELGGGNRERLLQEAVVEGAARALAERRRQLRLH